MKNKIHKSFLVLLAMIMLLTSIPLNLFATEGADGVGGYANPGSNVRAKSAAWKRLGGGYRISLVKVNSKEDLDAGNGTKIGKSVLYPTPGGTITTKGITSGMGAYDYQKGKIATEVYEIKNKKGFKAPADAPQKASPLFVSSPGIKDQIGQSQFMKSKMLPHGQGGWSIDYIRDSIFGEKVDNKGVYILAAEASGKTGSDEELIKQGKEIVDLSACYWKAYIEPVITMTNGDISTYKDMTSKQEFTSWAGKDNTLTLSTRDMIYFQVALYKAYNDLNMSTIPAFWAGSIEITGNTIYLTELQEDINMKPKTEMIKYKGDNPSANHIKEGMQVGGFIYDSLGVGVYYIEGKKKPEGTPSQFDGLYLDKKLTSKSKNLCDGGWDAEKQVWKICDVDPSYKFVEYCVTDSKDPLPKFPEDLDTKHPECKTVPSTDRPPEVPLKPDENIIVKWKKEKEPEPEKAKKKYKFTIPQWRLNRYVKEKLLEG